MGTALCYPDMTETLLKRCKVRSHPFIHPSLKRITVFLIRGANHNITSPPTSVDLEQGVLFPAKVWVFWQGWFNEKLVYYINENCFVFFPVYDIPANFLL